MAKDKEAIVIKFNRKEVVNKLNKLSKKFVPAPFLKIIRETLIHEIKENFATEGTSSGEKWKAWSTKYKKHMVKIGKPGNKILTDSAFLKNSFIGEISGNKLTIGTAVEYAAIHNFGHTKKKMPKRPFLRFSDATMEGILEDLNAQARKMAEGG
ncbi:MAG: phage virion morphogenesis protein [Candidatus Gastranaerophilaceae bacterium]